MRRLCAPRFLLAGILVGAVSAALATPAPKSKPEPLPPPTDEQFQQTEQNLKQIALACHNYEATYGRFPRNAHTKGDKPGLSWRVLLLPYLEENELYPQFKLDQPWDSEHNKKLIDKMPKVFAPVRGKVEKGETFYQSFSGKHGFLQPGGIVIAGITDGTSNTLMVAEAAKPVIWTKPDDLEFDGDTLPKLGGMFDGDFHVAFCDGSVRKLPKKLDADVLKALITVAGGEIYDLDSAIQKATAKE
jgi:Protein of unknown function (DUF1559)